MRPEPPEPLIPSLESGERLSPQVARRIRDLIMTGAEPGHARLRTEHLAERFGVSATPVREALMSLHGEGLVDFQPGRGFSVVPMSRQDVLDLYDAQAYLSGELAARAAVRLTDADLETLAALQRELITAIERGDLRATEKTDFEMHRLINRSAASPKLTWLLRLTLKYVPFDLYDQIPGWPAAARDDHLPILRGLEHRSARTARDAMTAHIRNAGDLLVELLVERGVLSDPDTGTSQTS
ncbi:GntR family transcriptional regulator [Pseudonocardia sp. Cha107L01]|uniref:GntR family transcriptional regulator n=1 Tax=Pseudonocardia sp. Cha107L01 TaxID=3457576 RepID=UPI00403E6464